MKIENPMKCAAFATALLASTTFSAPIYAQSAADLQALQDQMKALQEQIDTLKAEQEKTAAASAKVKKAEPASAMSTSDGMFEWNLRGRLFADTGWVSDSDNSTDIHASEMRAARLGLEGKAWKNVKYIIEVDFADNDADVKDAYLRYEGKAFDFTMGQFKTANSFEEITSARHTTFMERATFTDAFGFDRQIGLEASFGTDTSKLSVGVFQGGNGVGNDDEGVTIAARGHYAFELEGGWIHTGASFRHRDVGDDQSDFRYRVRPPIHVSDRFINTGNIAESDTFYGVELAGVMGPFHAAAEYGVQDTNLTTPVAGQSDPSFSGFYFEAGWFLTGEQKGYKSGAGTWDRPKVSKPVHQGGMGAWQIAARYDVTDLSDEGIFGGEQENITVGVNWYLNRHSRIMANYVMSDVKDAFLVVANGADGANDIDSFGLRFQVDW